VSLPLTLHKLTCKTHSYLFCTVGALLLASSAFAQEISQTAIISSAITSLASEASAIPSTAMSGIPVDSMTATSSGEVTLSSGASSAASATQTSSGATPSSTMPGGGYGNFTVTPDQFVDTTTPYNYSVSIDFSSSLHGLTERLRLL